MNNWDKVLFEQCATLNPHWYTDIKVNYEGNETNYSKIYVFLRYPFLKDVLHQSDYLIVVAVAACDEKKTPETSVQELTPRFEDDVEKTFVWKCGKTSVEDLCEKP